MMKKELYAAPETGVLELSIENAILSASNDINGNGLPGGSAGWGEIPM